jgi:D-alanine-D-alanine ligase
MRVAVLHNFVSPTAPKDEQDVLVQVEAVSQALRTLEHEVEAVPCTLNLETMRIRLSELAPDIVFNLVESLGGSDSLMHLATAVLDVIGLPYTGSSTEAIFVANQKVLAKQRMRAAGLPTPDWVTNDYKCDNEESGNVLGKATYIIKLIGEHASVGLSDDSILCDADEDELRSRMAATSAQTRRPCFAEQFIAGREFNLSLLADRGDVDVLPSAEIDFSAFPADKPHIVGYQAKWDEDSPEYQNTPRRFDFPESDHELLERLCRLAHNCWRLFGLRGYARVDFRVDANGDPWILEVNANPCLSPDAGFAAALSRAEIDYTDAINRIVAATLRNL